MSQLFDHYATAVDQMVSKLNNFEKLFNGKISYLVLLVGWLTVRTAGAGAAAGAGPPGVKVVKTSFIRHW